MLSVPGVDGCNIKCFVDLFFACLQLSPTSCLEAEPTTEQSAATYLEQIFAEWESIGNLLKLKIMLVSTSIRLDTCVRLLFENRGQNQELDIIPFEAHVENVKHAEYNDREDNQVEQQVSHVRNLPVMIVSR